MTTRRCLLPLTVLVFSSPVVAQDRLDLREADARESAYQLMSAAEQRFDCAFEEHSMEEIGVRSDMRYVVQVRTEGDDCREALTYLANLAAREDKLLFRHAPQPRVADEGDAPVMILRQDLVHEVNPDIEEDVEEPEEVRQN